MTRGRHNSMDNKWLIIAVVVGIVAVAAIAVAFFLGGNQGQVPGGKTTTVPSGSQVAGTGTTFPTVKPTTPVVIPAQGLFVEVKYIGGFNGTYGIDTTVQKVRNSGDRLFTIDSATGNVTATFTKEDKSSHVLTVIIWKDGRQLISATNFSAFGTASVAYTV